MIKRLKLDEFGSSSKYDNATIRWIDKGSHYELIFTDDFITPASTSHNSEKGFFLPRSGNALLTDIIMDMREGDKSKEVHVFVGSFGGEVAALNMILQQLLAYEYRVGINLGTACSCGWMLLFACQERYVSAFSQAMYHDISCYHGGKHTELQRNAEFMGRWQKELLKITDTVNVLTEKELELGRTTEVWFTGRELIDRGAAKDYQDYLCRRIPMPVGNLVFAGGKHYVQTREGWSEVALTDKKPLSYAELLKKANAPIDPAALLGIPPKASNNKLPKKSKVAKENKKTDGECKNNAKPISVLR